ncbi:thiamine-phosphate pyrophosphorylase [Nocardioides thalensis]|uniref:Thiamine-phosphate pyrophosphorylase n=1 Tax=Nocardioides thalensis TaxID=1914755 RepID=A0A853C5G5_9ACTN|nr:thiamine phosphate synthase [Nocardioides thalensis]NYJ02714.1 thiamine-phosphate pyrophosphorylase [Nocardioides thalensis]
MSGGLPRLLLLTDRSQLRLGRPLVRTLEECAAAGLTHVVVRELDLPDTHRALIAAEAAAVGLTVISAHRPLPGAAGVHLPASAAPTGAGGGGGALVGRSCHSADDVTRAVGATYATLSPYAPTRSKPGHGPPLPPSTYAGHAVPVFALGGITAANAADARAAGAHGVAVMGEVMRSPDPAATVAALLEAVA